MLRHAITFIIGAIIGIAIMLTRAVGPEARPVDPPTAAAAAAGDREPASGPGAGRSVSLPVDVAEPAETAAEPVPIRMPSGYRDMIGPPPQGLEPWRLHDRFEREPRDEAWAFSMEVGIRDHVQLAAAADVFVEYVQCRTTLCEIAGFETGTGRGFAPILEDMSAAGWWQAEGPVAHTTGEAAGLRRFVVLVGRR